jgi:hypothetical protein
MLSGKREVFADASGDENTLKLMKALKLGFKVLKICVGDCILHQQNDKNLVCFLSFWGLFCLSYRPASIHKPDKLDKNARLILN